MKLGLIALVLLSSVANSDNLGAYLKQIMDAMLMKAYRPVQDLSRIPEQDRWLYQKPSR